MDENMRKRIELAIGMMKELREKRDDISRFAEAIGASSGDALKKVYELNQDRIRGKVELFNRNIDDANSAYSRITETMNAWYSFSADDKQWGGLLFPFRLMKRRKDAKKNIRHCKDDINAISISNRLLREDILRLESTLECEASKSLREDVRYDEYNCILARKALLIDALQYLLPTIPGMPLRKISIDHIERQIEALEGMLIFPESCLLSI